MEAMTTRPGFQSPGTPGKSPAASMEAAAALKSVPKNAWIRSRLQGVETGGGDKPGQSRDEGFRKGAAVGQGEGSRHYRSGDQEGWGFQGRFFSSLTCRKASFSSRSPVHSLREMVFSWSIMSRLVPRSVMAPHDRQGMDRRVIQVATKPVIVTKTSAVWSRERESIRCMVSSHPVGLGPVFQHQFAGSHSRIQKQFIVHSVFLTNHAVKV